MGKIVVPKPKWTSELVLNKAREVHGSKFEYDLSDYKTLQSKIRVICKKHGDFFPTAKNHLFLASGCPGCFADRRGNSTKGTKRPGIGGRKPWNKERFVEEATKVHGNLYDYSQVIYINTRSKVTIVCPIHGSYEQLPHAHLQGQGCKKCAVKNRSTRVMDFKGM